MLLPFLMRKEMFLYKLHSICISVAVLPVLVLILFNPELLLYYIRFICRDSTLHYFQLMVAQRKYYNRFVFHCNYFH